MMPRLVLVAIAALSAIVAPAAAQHPWADYRHVSGAITLGGVPGSEPELALRCGYLAEPRLGQGPLGHVEPLLPQEGDGRHPFAVLDGRMGFFDGLIEIADYDVAFYASLGSCSDPSAPPVVLTRHDGPWNEEGVIPEGARYALIWLGNEKIESAFEMEIHPPAE